MEGNTFIEKLMDFGLTRQETQIYRCLLQEGKTTGYEVAKLVGISRSNAYNSLASMTEKGAACLVEEGTIRKYVPVPLNEFCTNFIRRVEEDARWLSNHEPSGKLQEVGYITIEGAQNLQDKIRNLLSDAQESVYLSCTSIDLLLFTKELEQILQEDKQLVILTDQAVSYHNARIYVGEPRGTQFGLIVDEKYVLIGEFGEDSLNSGLYSGQKSFVELSLKALDNEIKLLEI